MIVWLVIALIIAAIILMARWSFKHSNHIEIVAGLSAYRDQIKQISLDRAAGLIDDAEAARANAEVSRRLITAADVAEFKHAIPIGSPLWRCRAAIIGVFVLLPVVSLALYLLLGFQ